MLDDGIARKFKKGRDVHEANYLHRRSAPASQASRTEGVFRLCGPWLLHRGYAARQPRRSRSDQVPPADPGRRLQARSLHDNSGGAGVAAADPGAGRTTRHAVWRRRNRRLPRGAGCRHSLHAEHDVDLLDRGCRRRRRQAVLVPALRDEGSRLHQVADRACDRSEVQRAGAHRRSAGDRTASPGHQEWNDDTAAMVAVEIDRFRHQAGLGRRRDAGQAPHLRQHRRPHQGH